MIKSFTAIFIATSFAGAVVHAQTGKSSPAAAKPSAHAQTRESSPAAAKASAHPKSSPAAAKSSANPLTDAEIAMILVAAGKVDIEAGKLAEEKGSNAKVKEFAQSMISDHTSLNSQATELAKKAGFTPEDSSTSRKLKSDGDKNLANLRKLKGAAFDKAYIDNEIAYHESILKTIDDTLTPNATTAEFRDLLESARPTFVSHLEHAKEAKASLR